MREVPTATICSMNFWEFKIMEIINGRKLRDDMLARLKSEVASLSFVPAFADVLVGDDAASAQYVRMKNEMAKSLGIRAVDASYPATITTEELIARIVSLAEDPHLSGLIVQLPLPSSIDKDAVLAAIPREIDVDCLNPISQKMFYSGESVLEFPTARAIMTILKSLKVSLSEKKIVMVGRGELVGRPVTQLLTAQNCHVTVLGSTTLDAPLSMAAADILITATGRPSSITGAMIKEGAVVIDAGTSESFGSVVGDVDRASVASVASILAPVPGGVGPLTVALLFDNVLRVARAKNK